MMLNVHSIINQTIQALKQNELFSRQVCIKDLQSHLVIQVDNILQNILINLADNYPQAPASGGTPRMREAIN